MKEYLRTYREIMKMLLRIELENMAREIEEQERLLAALEEKAERIFFKEKEGRHEGL